MLVKKFARFISIYKGRSYSNSNSIVFCQSMMQNSGNDSRFSSLHGLYFHIFASTIFEVCLSEQDSKTICGHAQQNCELLLTEV